MRYDNLKPAVTRILKGRDRDEAERLLALRSHCGFESFFCQPGLRGAHEKGGVEAEIGRFRRRHLVPVPKTATLAKLNEHIEACDLLDESRVITGCRVTIGAAFAAERTALMPLPVEAFDPARLLQARVDKRSRISVRQCYYSVPARYVARRLSVRLSARTVAVFDGPKRVAAHQRAFGRNVEVLALDHYLEVLKTKPGGLPGATALVQAKTAGTFTVSHQRYWDVVRRAHGDAAGTRAMVEVLLAHRTLPAGLLVAAMDRAVQSGALDPQVVLIDARRTQAAHIAPVIPIAALTRYDRPHRRWPATTNY